MMNTPYVDTISGIFHFVVGLNFTFDMCMVAEDDHLQVFENYEKLKKQIKAVSKRFHLKFNFKYEYFLV